MKKILDHLGLWNEDRSRGPPQTEEISCDLIDDGWFSAEY